MGVFDKFDKMVNKGELQKNIDKAKANTYDEVPKGTYIVSIEKMEVKPTKAGDKLMFSTSCKIVETLNAPNKQDGRWIFFNRVIFGNRVTEKWDDGVAIAGVITWVEKLLNDEEIEFTSYGEFADEISNISDDVKNLEIKIEYDGDAFDPIKIKEVYEA